jgi:dihydrofolate synthase/folylpolyglutamate synthase
MDRSSAILERLLHLHPREIDLSLDRIERLLAALGNPDKRLPPIIHVTGTNGKGSTTAFMRAMLEANGSRVHVYSSPHLIWFHERIRLARPGGSGFVDDDMLADALLEVERINTGDQITQYEITTAAAFIMFANVPADVLLLEVGLGGRLDATNVITSPLASVITSLSMDHEKFLGNTVTDIAHEKAGILKAGSPAIIAPQDEEALVEIERQAEIRGSDLFLGNRDWVAYAERGRLVYQDEDGLLDLPSPRLLGRHQYTNAGTAIATLRRAGLAPSTASLEAGLLGVDWPARLQPLTSGALVQLSRPDAEIWLDGGHNPAAGVVIAEAMADLEERDPKPLVLIVGMLSNKESKGFLKPFASLAGHVFTVPVPGTSAGRDPGELATIANSIGMTAEAVASVHDALERIASERADEESPRILICGSLYLAGATLADNGTIIR